MLAPPIVALAIFAIARPESTDADARTLVIGAALVVGANVTGATQLERAWAFAATLGAALFASLGVVLAAAGVGGTAATGQVAPPVAHAVVAVLLGLAGGTASALVGAAVTTVIRGVRRFAVAATAGLAAATLVAALVLGQ